MIKNETAKKTCYHRTIQQRYEDDSTVMLGIYFLCFLSVLLPLQGSTLLLNKTTIRPQIKPLRIANRNKFPQICGEDCNPLRVICGTYFSFNTLLYVNFNLSITINQFFVYV